MPIRPDQRWFYPIDWAQLSRIIRFERAGGRCEHCRRPHGRQVLQSVNGLWWDDDRRHWRGDRGKRVRALPCPEVLIENAPMLSGFETRALPNSLSSTLVILATAHLDHDPSNNRARNLAALCQRCHLAHDRSAHRRQRWATLFYRRALGDLFTGIYR